MIVPYKNRATISYETHRAIISDRNINLPYCKDAELRSCMGEAHEQLFATSTDHNR